MFDNLLYGHTDEDTALVVDDYPYGFRARTSIRYWIETVARKGDRFVSQTLNPKTGRWNKPKKSTYSTIKVLRRDPETGYINHIALSPYSEDPSIQGFIAIKDNLNDTQRQHLASAIGYKEAYKHVTFSIVEGPETPEEAEERNRKGKEAQETVNKYARAIAAKTYREELSA